MEWKTIDSAPKDGTIILIGSNRPGWVYAAYWGLANDVASCDANSSYPWVFLDEENGINLNMDNEKYGPTHWMEFPKAPQ